MLGMQFSGRIVYVNFMRPVQHRPRYELFDETYQTGHALHFTFYNACEYITPFPTILLKGPGVSHLSFSSFFSLFSTHPIIERRARRRVRDGAAPVLERRAAADVHSSRPHADRRRIPRCTKACTQLAEERGDRPAPHADLPSARLHTRRPPSVHRRPRTALHAAAAAGVRSPSGRVEAQARRCGQEQDRAR